MAFRQEDVKVGWSMNDFGNVYSSPILIDVAGLEQLVVLMDGAIFAAVVIESGSVSIMADQKLITLDQDGNVMIAYPRPRASERRVSNFRTARSWTDKRLSCPKQHRPD